MHRHLTGVLELCRDMFKISTRPDRKGVWQNYWEDLIQQMFHSPGWPVKGRWRPPPTSNSGRCSAVALSTHLAWSCRVSCSTTCPAHLQGHLCLFPLKPKEYYQITSRLHQAKWFLLVTPSYPSYLLPILLYLTAFRAWSLVDLWLHSYPLTNPTVILSNHWVNPKFTHSSGSIPLFFCIYCVIYDIYRPFENKLSQEFSWFSARTVTQRISGEPPNFPSLRLSTPAQRV